MNIQNQTGQNYLPSSFYTAAPNYSLPQYSSPYPTACACTGSSASSAFGNSAWGLSPEYSTRLTSSGSLPIQASSSLACTIGQMVIDAVQRGVSYLLHQVFGIGTGSSAMTGMSFAPSIATGTAATTTSGTSSGASGIWNKIVSGASDAFGFIRENWDTIKDVGSVVLSKLPTGGIGGLASGVWNFAKNILSAL